jgi:hypothetical protein
MEQQSSPDLIGGLVPDLFAACVAPALLAVEQVGYRYARPIIEAWHSARTAPGHPG